MKSVINYQSYAREQQPGAFHSAMRCHPFQDAVQEWLKHGLAGVHPQL